MTGFARSHLYPPAVQRQAGLDPAEINGKKRSARPDPAIVESAHRTGTASRCRNSASFRFWSLPEAQRESILKAEQEYREQAEAERLESGAASRT